MASLCALQMHLICMAFATRAHGNELPHLGQKRLTIYMVVVISLFDPTVVGKGC